MSMMPSASMSSNKTHSPLPGSWKTNSNTAASVGGGVGGPPASGSISLSLSAPMAASDLSLANDVHLTLSGIEYINFSLFRAMHHTCLDPQSQDQSPDRSQDQSQSQSQSRSQEFSYYPRMEDIRRLLDSMRSSVSGNNNEESSASLTLTLSSVSNLSSIDALYAYRQQAKQTTSPDSPPQDLGSLQYYVQPMVSSEFLSFFFRSLSGDLECFKCFTSALKYEGSFLSGPLGLKTLMPGFYLFLSQHSLKSLVSDLLSRKVSTSPFQR
jgi:hypothetical protein